MSEREAKAAMNGIKTPKPSTHRGSTKPVTTTHSQSGYRLQSAARDPHLQATASPPIKARYRTRSGLRPFNPTEDASTLFPANEALIDKLGGWIEVGFVCPTPDAFLRLVTHWRSKPKPRRATPGHRPLLVIDDAYGGGTKAFKLRVTDGWLISGDGELKFNPSNRRGRLTLKLTLNPTRWLGHLDIEDLKALRALENIPPTRSLRATFSKVDIRALDNKDNLLDLTRLGPFESRGERRALLLSAFGNAVETLVREWLDPASDDVQGAPASAGLTLTGPVQLAAAKPAEIYWELTAINAVAAVKRLVEALQRRAPDVQWTCSIKARQFITAGIEADALWITLPLVKDVSLKVYAKTAERIRFEITHWDHISNTAKRAGRRELSFASTLEALCTDSSRRIALVWSTLSQDLQPPPGGGDVSDLFSLMARSGLGDEGFRLLAQLSATGRITEHAEFSQEAITALTRFGVLGEPKRLARGGVLCYPLAPAWRVTFERLRTAARTAE